MNYKLNQEINTLEVDVDKYRTFYYAAASGDFNPIHLDPEFAKSVGLDGIILHGLCSMAYVYRAVVGDRDPACLKSLKVRFSGMVKPLDHLSVKGKVISVENNNAVVGLIVENQKKEQVINNAQAVVKL